MLSFQSTHCICKSKKVGSFSDNRLTWYFLFSDKDYFPEPERYNPDRWSAENRDSIPKYAFLGFGEGPRICLGMKFALSQIKGGLASILSKYDVITTPKTEIPLTFSKATFNLQPQNGIWLKFVKRNKWEAKYFCILAEPIELCKLYDFIELSIQLSKHQATLSFSLTECVFA